MRLSRPLRVCVVIWVVAAFWGFCAFAWWLLAGVFGIQAAVFLLGPAVIILLLLHLASCDQALLWNKLVRTMWRGAGETLAVLRLVRWRVGAIACFVLALLTGFLWLRSFWWIDSLYVPVRGTRYVTIRSCHGVITVGWDTDSERSGNERVQWDARTVELRLTQMRTFFPQPNRKMGDNAFLNPGGAFDWTTGSVTIRGRTFGSTSASFPHWVPVALFSMAPAVSVAEAYRRYRRRCRGLCWECGYDLTGNESGVCPECGTPK